MREKIEDVIQKVTANVIDCQGMPLSPIFRAVSDELRSTHWLILFNIRLSVKESKKFRGING